MTIMYSRYFLSLLLVLFLAAACGQKGPLYLPGNPSEIKSDVPSQDQSQTEDDEEEEEEKPQNED